MPTFTKKVTKSRRCKMAPYGAVEAGVSQTGVTRRGRWIPLVVAASALCLAVAVAVAAVMLSPSGAATLLLKPAQRPRSAAAQVAAADPMPLPCCPHCGVACASPTSGRWR